MLRIREALDVILPAFTPRPAERVPLDDALGRILATELAAREDAPPFDASAMDGYAVRAEDLAAASADQPVRLPIAGESRAGSAPGPALAPSTCIRILTGAPVPEGATVIAQEDTTREGDHVVFSLAPRPRQHVRARGEDTHRDRPILAAGTRLGAGEIALLASQSYAHVAVHARPRVAVLSNGDELRGLGEAPRPGSIIDSNAHMLAAAVRAAGGIPVVLPTARDDLDELVARVRTGLEADVLVTSGGVSVGDHDLLHDAFAQAGVSRDFWKVRMKPGKPLAFGRAGRTPVLGLPGNPVSAWVGFELFVRPGLRRMLGDPRPHRAWARARLGRAMPSTGTRTELARATLALAADGRLVATPLVRQGSGSLPSIAAVDALAVLPESPTRIEEGTDIDVLLLLDERGRETPVFV